MISCQGVVSHFAIWHHEGPDQQTHGQLPQQARAWHQVLHARPEARGQGGPLQCHLADPLQGKQLQPHYGNVSSLFKREVPDHVCSCHGLPQQEERGLLQLSAQGKQAVDQDLRCCSFFPPFFLLVRKAECFIQSDPVLYA